MLEYCCPIFQKRLYSQTHRGLQIAFTRFLKLNSLTLLEYAQKIQIPVEMKKCCFCERPAKITAKIINGKLEFSYSVRCGHDNCKGTNLNTQSKEYLMVVNN
jgi:thymidine kinase